jgi:hypothetical protein
LSVEAKGSGLWQANFKLPPGLTAGFHEVRIRTRGSGFSNPIRIAVDVPAQAATLSVTGVCDGRTWKPGDVMLQPDGVLTLWVQGLPENADGNNTEVWLGAEQLRVTYVLPYAAGGPSQINAEVTAGFPLGEAMLRVRISEASSRTVPVRILRVPRPDVEVPI